MNSVDIQDYMDKYTDLGNQGVTNVGENVRYMHTRVVVMINVGLAQTKPNNAHA